MQTKFNLSHKIILSLLIITLMSSLCFSFARAQPFDDVPKTRFDDKGGATLSNPLGESANNPNVLIGRIIKNILGIVGSLALLMFVVGGLMWMLSAGNEQRVKKGKDILIWASLGLVIIFTSYAILKFVFEVLTKTN